MNRAFTRLLAAAACANSADGMSGVSFPILAVTFTSSPLAISLVSAARTLPWLIASMHVGALIDRNGPAWLLFRSHAIRSVVFLVVILLTFERAHAFVLFLTLGALSVGVLEVAADNSTQTLTPRVVSAENLSRGNARIQLIENTGVYCLGPPIASALASISLMAPLMLIVAAYSIAAAIIRKLARGVDMCRQSARTLSLLAGWTHIRRSRTLCVLAACTSLMNFATAGAAAILVLYVKQQLHAPVWSYGLLFTALAAGPALGAAATPRILAATGEAAVLRSVLLALPVPMLMLAVATHFWLAAGAQIIFGALETGWGIVTVTFRQEAVPADLLGRVNAIYRMISWGSIPIGTFTAGVLARFFDIRTTYLLLTVALCSGWVTSLMIRRRLFNYKHPQYADGLVTEGLPE